MFDKNLLKQLKKIRKIHNKRIKIENRIEENLKQVKLTKEETNFLDEASKNFFPTSGRWSSSELKKDENCLLCHLRDDYWLSKALKDEIELHNNNFNIELYKVLKYVKTSSKFRYERHEYEQRVIRWQINYMLTPNSKFLICEKIYGEDFMVLSQNCDIEFRQSVKDTLLAVGINEAAIEEGLIKNSNLWLDRMIEQTFINRYDSLLWNVNFFERKNYIEIPPATTEHKESWMLLRKCQFVEKYDRDIIKYGNKEWLEIMRSLPKTEERAELQLKVERLNIIRKEEIKEYKQQRQQKTITKK